jgi:hypothetical protein
MTDPHTGSNYNFSRVFGWPCDSVFSECNAVPIDIGAPIGIGDVFCTPLLDG